MNTKINYLASFFTCLMLAISTFSFAQENKKSGGGGASYLGPGNLNVGLSTYWSYSSSLGVQLDYEFNLARDFTVGPSLSYAGYSDSWYNYSVFGLGARFRWYADRVLNITHPKWDVFANGDIGFSIWSHKYTGPGTDPKSQSSTSPLWIGLGIGGKFHFNDKIGLQLIIGSGAQIGLHFQL
ncbi:hypothetical protein [Flammeovirga pacifica]|nr:hypothetical protein [Flammeovirga pacifica]